MKWHVCPSLNMPLGPLRKAADVRSLMWPAMFAWLTNICWQNNIFWGVPLLMYFSFACAAIAHNSMHCDVFYSKTLEEVWRIVLSLSYGHPVNTFLPGHNLSHHVYLQQHKDLMRTDQMTYRWPFLNFLLFQPQVAPKIFIQDLHYMRTRWTRARQLNKMCRYTVTTILQGGLVVGALGYLMSQSWRKALLYWVIPRLFAQWAIVTMNLLQHDGCDSLEEKNLNFARNFVGPSLNYLMFNNGFHTIHHQMPNTHWSQLPYMHKRIVAPHIRPDLDQTSMLLYIWKTYILDVKQT